MIGLFLGGLSEPLILPVSLAGGRVVRFNFIDSLFSKLSFMYNFPGYFITLFVAVYLLLTLFVVVKLSLKYVGPMRSN